MRGFFASLRMTDAVGVIPCLRFQEQPWVKASGAGPIRSLYLGGYVYVCFD